MRIASLFCVLSLIGCLRAPPIGTSRNPPDPHVIASLINAPDTIAEAAKMAAREGWPLEDFAEVAKAAYWNYAEVEAYALAAEVAHALRLDPSYVAYAVRAAHRRAVEELKIASRDRLSMYLVTPGSLSSPSLPKGEDFLIQEIAAACRFGPSQATRLRAVRHAFEAVDHSGARPRVLYELFDRKCPLNPAQQTRIVEAAIADQQALRGLDYAKRSFWTQDERDRFATSFLIKGPCVLGFAAAASLGTPDAKVVAALETPKCQCEPDIDPQFLPVRSREQAAAFFFAALKGEEYRLAYALMPRTPFVADQARTYLAEAAFKGHDELDLQKIYEKDPELRRAAFAWALANGRARHVGNIAKEAVWERKAFDVLITEGKFEDAAEIAQYGVDEAFRSAGLESAFVAAIRGRDLDAVRALVYRYGKPLTEKRYLLEWEKIHDEEPPSLYPHRRKIPRRKPCKPPDGWEVTPTCR